VRIYAAKTAANARRFLRDLDRAAPMRITRVLTDNVLRQEYWHPEGQQISLR
jgi:hypothetical protein